jgi:periplasmic protein TonB
MFHSVLDRKTSTKFRFGAGSAAALLAHAVAIGTTLSLSTGTPAAQAPQSTTPFYHVAIVKAATALGNQVAAVQTQPAPAATTARRSGSPKRAAVPTAVPTTPSVQPSTSGSLDSDSTAGSQGDETNEGASGEGNGPATGGTPGTADGQGTDFIAFGEGMTKPQCAWDFEYTREAREARSEGLLILKCNIMADGTVSGCRAIKGVPHMTEAVLAAAARTKCTPATFQGQPVSVSVTQSLRLISPP